MAINPLHANRGPTIFLVAVIRYTDKKIVASYSVSQDVTKEGVRELIASNASCVPGKRYSAVGDSQAVHYMLDSNGRVYAMVTEPRYPTRVAFAAIDEIMTTFQKEFGARIASATEGSLSKSAKPILADNMSKYANPGSMDKLTAVQDKVEVVKTVMKDNIQQMLLNEEKLKKIEESTEHLNEQSEQFKKSTKELQDKMWWKMWKMRLLIGGLVIAVLIVIIAPVAATSSSSSSNGN